MIKTTLQIEVMACAMCESHVNDAIRSVAAVKKVTSSRKKGTSEILSDIPLDERKIRTTIEATGYRVLSCTSEPYRRKGLFG